MSQVHIVTDSASHIPEALREELNIHVVHLPFAWDGETYLDEIDMGKREFYARLRSSSSQPTTSGPTPGSYLEKYEQLAERGGEILMIHVGSEFSSAHQTAKLAKSMLPNAPIHLIDSHSNAMGLGFQVLAVARAARDGMEFEELLDLAEDVRAKSGVIFYVEDVGYMHRGGRVNLGQRVLASILNIIPILQINGGPIEITGRARSKKAAMNKMAEIVAGIVQAERPLRIAVHHADDEKTAFALRQLVEQELNPDELMLEEVSPILGIHTGPGAVGMAYSVG